MYSFGKLEALQPTSSTFVINLGEKNTSLDEQNFEDETSGKFEQEMTN